MRGVGIAIVFCAGCSGRGASPQIASTPPPTPDAAPAVDLYDLPAAVAPPAYDVQCEDFAVEKTPPENARTKTYDLDPTPLPLGDAGPTYADRTRRGYGRSPATMRGVIRRREDAITACWKAAAATAAATVQASFDVDSWGRVDAVAVAGTDDAKLQACLEAAITGSRATGLSTHRTHATVPLALQVSGQPAWKKKPKWPKAPKALPLPFAGHRCATVLRDAPPDELILEDPLAFDDWDAAREPKSKDKGEHASPSIRICQPKGYSDLDKRTIRGALAGNAGELGRCHAEARGRDAALAGDVTVMFTVIDDGTVQVAQVGGAGDDALHDCLRDALGMLWFDPASKIATEVHLTWQLVDPPDPEPVESLAALDAKLSAQPHGAKACGWRWQVVQRIADEVPWLDDPRLDAAVADLAAEASTLDADDAAACLADTDDLLRGMLRPTEYDHGLRERLALLDALLPVADALPESLRGDALRLQRAAILGAYDRAAGREAALAIAGSDDPDSDAGQLAEELSHEHRARCYGEDEDQ